MVEAEAHDEHRRRFMEADRQVQADHKKPGGSEATSQTLLSFPSVLLELDTQLKAGLEPLVSFHQPQRLCAARLGSGLHSTVL